MSVINKKPFIVNVIDDMTLADINTLTTLINGGGDQTPILRTMAVRPTGTSTKITSADKGVHLCMLEVETSLFKGYLIYTDNYCVLVHFTDSNVLGMFNINVSKNEFATVSEELSVLELRSELNDAYPAEEVEVIEAVNDALDDGAIKIKVGHINSEESANGYVIASNGEGGAEWRAISSATYGTFDASWTTNGTIAEFCASVDADANAVEGMAYLGELYCSDLPTGLVNVDTVVEIMSGTGTSGKVIHVIITSGNVAPYRWEYTYWNSGANVSGWIGFQPELPTVINNRYLHTNSSTGALEWSEVSSGIQVVELPNSSGTLSIVRYNILAGNEAVILAGTQYYYKEFSTSTTLEYKALPRLGVNKVIIEKYTIERATRNYELHVEEFVGGTNYLAPAYDSSVTYNVSDLVVYDNALYVCNTNNTTGTWDSTKWDATTVAESVLGLINLGV